MKSKLLFIYIFLPLLLAVVFIFSLISGSSDISFIEAFKALFSEQISDNALIVKSIRFPRIIMAMAVGAGLAVSGCVFQAVLKNPLAEPFTLGISGGASFGAAIAFVFGLASNLFVLPLFAFSGSLFAVFIVYVLSMRKRFDSNSMLLSGVIISYVFSSAVMLLFAISDASRMQAAFMWLIGNFSSFDERLLPIVAAINIAGVIILCLIANIINIISIGADKSKSLGLNVNAAIKVVFIIASFIAASSASACGVIGFVGLMSPHIMRKFVGANHIYLMPASALFGAIFLPFCDTISRIIVSPVILPVGVITNIAGGIFFITLLLKERNNA
ncbi:MAG: iron ABC transporter permease [Endomicrobium sp.]|jgi:iron complex transport system permease protein|nr:iron ABC transporter permease [Endomicrobium sp.]